jgi:hypothetical protein
MPVNLSAFLDSSFRGTQGIQGSTGSQGTQGIQGRQGTTGSQGTQGIQGTQGSTGSQGTQGIQGTQGSTGSQGTQGIQGRQGTTGSQGIQGIQGNFGIQGTQGISIQGTTGSQGIQGIQGNFGIQGTQGISIQGTTGSQGIQGLNGPSNVISAFDTTTNSTFYPVFVAGTGNQTPSIRTTSPPFSFNPSTSNLFLDGSISIGTLNPQLNSKLHVAGNVKVDGSVEVDGSVGISSVKITRYNSVGSGTFTRDPKTIIAQVFVTGGGGGGGGSDSDGSSGSCSGGGGGGGTSIKWLTAAQLGTTATYTVGGGGAAGTVLGGNGGNGSNSIFTCTGIDSIVLVGTGGEGGFGTGSAYAANTSAFNGGNGGIPTGGDILHTGLDGLPGLGVGNNTVTAGNGGASYWGGGANGPVRFTAGSNAGINATQPGAGGSGAVNINLLTGVVGGTGAAGTILIVEYLKL